MQITYKPTQEKKMTPFEKTLDKAKKGQVTNIYGKPQLPTIIWDGKEIDAIRYQLAVSKAQLRIASIGIKPSREWKLKTLKNYYGLDGRTAKACHEEFISKFNHLLNKIEY